MNFANQVALGSSSGQRTEETGNRLAAMRLETGRRIRETGRTQQRRLTRLETRIAELESTISGEATQEGSQAQFDARNATATSSERLVTEARESVASAAEQIREESSAIQILRTARNGQAEQLEDAERDLVSIAEEQPTTDEERQDQSARVAVASQRRADLRAQIQQTDAGIDQRAGQLQSLTTEQSTAIDGLEALEANAGRDRDAADEASEALVANRANLAVAETQRASLVEDTARQVEELISLYRGLLEQMEVSVTTDAGIGLDVLR